MHIVTGQIQRDQSLEDNGPAWECGSKEDEQAGGCATIGDHVENSAKAGGLLEDAGCIAIEGVEETGDGVKEGAGAWVEGHVVEGTEGKDNADVACRDVRMPALGGKYGIIYQ